MMEFLFNVFDINENIELFPFYLKNDDISLNFRNELAK